MKKIILLLVSSLLLLYSCKNEKPSTEQKRGTTEETSKKDTLNADSEHQTETLKTGKKPSDLVPDGYEIQYDAEGDLNQDGISDVALVIRKKEDTLAGRKMLILLKNTDTTYRLDKISDTVLPDEYNEAGYKMHDPEDISIEKGELNINLYDIGPYGNQFSKFKYLNGDLILTYIETYNMGAGSHSALYYEPMKGKVVHETVNTMEEEMPSESKTSHLKKERYLFEKTSPEEIIRKLYDSVGE
ncbi:hypothetical protein CLU96_1598 [Chryseobacterium sp. 52]|uniref:hypothetical protein n=1 Tax=Chryseobacterium sp. 52 TaxID=2035213 RepID=UPI000C1A2038|nr:hypothetical protein [Chryseobacterium sp. 52]PIF44621.1 hypothetical protein CLU96_1598 [Chryseobacterium sp. 52]